MLMDLQQQFVKAQNAELQASTDILINENPSERQPLDETSGNRKEASEGRDTQQLAGQPSR